MDLGGRGAVVTGGGRGIGAAVAEALAASGARLVVAARTRREIEQVASSLRKQGHDAFAVPCDVTNPAQVRSLARAAVRRLGHVDILVNNAGAASSAPVRSLELKEWNRLFAVNATGTLLCTQSFLPGMTANRWGRIVNVVSVVGLAGAAYIAAYAASKHAALGFTRCAAAEAAPHGVTVNAVCPGYVDTPLTQETLRRIVSKTGITAGKALETLKKASPQNRLITPEEVAHAVRFLCAEESRGINGQALVLDGGALLA